MPSVTGELLEKLRPYLDLANQIGMLLAQLSEGALKEITVEYAGDFQGLDMAPVTTAVLKGILTPIIKDDVNFVNAPSIANERGIKVIEATSPDPKEYLNLITVKSRDNPV